MATKLGLNIGQIGSLILATVLIWSCIDDVDFSGLIRSTDRVNTRFTQSEEWNKTHPFQNIDVVSENYNILIAADVHVGDVKNLNTFLTEAAKPENIAFVLNGDFVTGKKDDFDRFNTQLNSQNLTKPYFLTVGNHELYFDGWKTFYEYFGTSVYYFTVNTSAGNDIYFCLDTGGGTLGSKQLEWLRSTLVSERHKYRNCIVFSHVNFFRDRRTASTNPLVPELYVLIDLFAKHTVNLVIMGHDHVRATDELGKTTYLTLDALSDEATNASYLQLQVTKSDFRYEFTEINH